MKVPFKIGVPTYRSYAKVVLLAISLRLIFALIIQTTFVPDEYYQTIEPAFAAIVRPERAIITWEWRDHYRLRSVVSLLPYMAYYFVAELLRTSPISTYISLLPHPHNPIAGPRIAQALLSCLGDVAVFDIAMHLCPTRPEVAWGSFILHMFGWSGMYMHSRTLTNCSEAALVAIAGALLIRAYQSCTNTSSFAATKEPERSKTSYSDAKACVYIATAAVLSVLAVFTRPTALAILAPIWLYTAFEIPRRSVFAYLSTALTVGVTITSMCIGFDYIMYSNLNNSNGSTNFTSSISEVCSFDSSNIASSAVHCIETLLPYFTTYNFFKWNILRNFSAKFGVNAWHWNFTQGLPAMLGGNIIFLVLTFFKMASAYYRCGKSSVLEHYAKALRLYALALIYCVTLSLSPHKEFRFLLPCLPAVYIATSIAIRGDTYVEVVEGENKALIKNTVITEDNSTRNNTSNGDANTSLYYKLLRFATGCVCICHVLVALYLCTYHQSGGELLMKEINRIAQQRTSDHSCGSSINGKTCDNGNGASSKPLLVDLIMPCHATPGYSSIYYNQMTTDINKNRSPSFLIRYPDCSPDLPDDVLTETALLRRDGAMHFISCIHSRTFPTAPLEDTSFDKLSCADYDHQKPWHSSRYQLYPSATSNTTDRKATITDTASLLDHEPFPGDVLVLFDSDASAATHSMLVRLGYAKYKHIPHAHFRYDADDPAPKQAMIIYVGNESMLELKL